MTSFSFFKYFDAFELDVNVVNFVYYGKTRIIRNMYKGSEPMGRLHSVQKHMANVYLPLQFKEVKM